jgi:hypothetical protein
VRRAGTSHSVAWTCLRGWVPENDFVFISVQLHGPVVVARLALSADGVRLQTQRLANTLLELVSVHAGSEPGDDEYVNAHAHEKSAVTRAAGANRGLVAHQSPAAHRQDGWATGQAHPVLLVDVRRGLSDAAAVRGDAPADLGAPGAGGLAERWATTPERAGSCSSNRRESSGPSSSGAGGPLPEALTTEKCYRAMIVSCAKLNSPSRADQLLSGDWATRRSQSGDSKMEIPD